MPENGPPSGSKKPPIENCGENFYQLVHLVDGIQRSLDVLRRDLHRLIHALAVANRVDDVGESPFPQEVDRQGVVPADSSWETDSPEDDAMYCCPEPVLRWNGDPEAPSICCQKCGFVVAEYGELQDHPAESRPSQPSAPAANAQEGAACGPTLGLQLDDASTEEVTDRTGIPPATTSLNTTDGTRTTEPAPVTSAISAAVKLTPAKPARKRKKGPLLMRIFQEPLLTDVVRAVGHQVWPLEELQRLLAPLHEHYSATAIDEAVAELLISIQGYWQLTPDVREKATTLLGKSN
jgi:hypothetical protein